MSFVFQDFEESPLLDEQKIRETLLHYSKRNFLWSQSAAKKMAFTDIRYHPNRPNRSQTFTDMGWTIKKCRIAFSASSRLPTKEFFCNGNYRQNTIFEQNLKTFGQCQNFQNQTFKWPYQLYKSKFMYVESCVYDASKPVRRRRW